MKLNALIWGLAALLLVACENESSSASEEVVQPETPPTTPEIPLQSDSLPPVDTVTVVPHVPHGFDPCQFNFGAAWQAAHEDEEFYKGLDYIAVWLGDNDFYNFFEQRMVDVCIAVNATPMIYAYVIAEFGKDMGLVDCDMADAENPKSLCTHGADIIRNYFADSVLSRYEKYASGLRNQVEIFWEKDPNTYETIWLVEPDFYQYSESASNQKFAFDSVAQENGGIPDAEMGAYFKQIVNVIRTYLPAAKIAIDISPWISDVDTLNQDKWYGNFDMTIIDYLSTSGGRTSAASEYVRMGNKAKWRYLYELTGKPILADAGYDKGGAGTGHATIWDKAQNILPRMADGVVGVMQMDAKYGYPAIVDTIRPQLNYTYPWCAD